MTNTTRLADLEGFCADIFRRFLRYCKIRYRLYKNADGLWGGRVDGEWNGMIGQLVNGKADMGTDIVSISKGGYM